MNARHGLTVALAAGIVTTIAASAALAAPKARKSCVRTAGGYIVCQQGDQTCSTSPQGRTVCIRHGSNPTPSTQTCTTLPDGTRICVSGR